jgi:hypothetical protein
MVAICATELPRVPPEIGRRARLNNLLDEDPSTTDRWVTRGSEKRYYDRRIGVIWLPSILRRSRFWHWESALRNSARLPTLSVESSCRFSQECGMSGWVNRQDIVFGTGCPGLHRVSGSTNIRCRVGRLVWHPIPTRHHPSTCNWSADLSWMVSSVDVRILKLYSTQNTGTQNKAIKYKSLDENFSNLNHGQSKA